MAVPFILVAAALVPLLAGYSGDAGSRAVSARLGQHTEPNLLRKPVDQLPSTPAADLAPGLERSVRQLKSVVKKASSKKRRSLPLARATGANETCPDCGIPGREPAAGSEPEMPKHLETTLQKLGVELSCSESDHENPRIISKILEQGDCAELIEECRERLGEPWLQDGQFHFHDAHLDYGFALAVFPAQTECFRPSAQALEATLQARTNPQANSPVAGKSACKSPTAPMIEEAMRTACGAELGKALLIEAKLKLEPKQEPRRGPALGTPKLAEPEPALKRELAPEAEAAPANLVTVTSASSATTSSTPASGKPPVVDPVPATPATASALPNMAETAAASPESDANPMDSAGEERYMGRSDSGRKPLGWDSIEAQGKVIGFQFENQGGNAILGPKLDIGNDQLYKRSYRFQFEGRARQDIQLWLTDSVPPFGNSDLMESVYLFFPRKTLPSIAPKGDLLEVTLPTGETVEFDAATKEVIGGALLEKALDLNPNKRTRKFTGVDYTGEGLSVRVNARGRHPLEPGTIAVITRATAEPGCTRGAKCTRCEVPSSSLWSKSPARDIHFRFPDDASFEVFLRKVCGFGIPQF